MSMEGDLVAKVVANAAVTALIVDRMSPLIVPQDENLPALSYQVIDTLHVESMGGSSGLAASRVQISAWSRTYLEAIDLAEKVRIAIHGYTGTMGSTQAVAILVLDGPRDGYEPATGSDVAIYRRDYDYQIHFKVTQP
jgi:hypothetical protein